MLQGDLAVYSGWFFAAVFLFGAVVMGMLCTYILDRVSSPQLLLSLSLSSLFPPSLLSLSLLLPLFFLKSSICSSKTQAARGRPCKGGGVLELLLPPLLSATVWKICDRATLAVVTLKDTRLCWFELVITHKHIQKNELSCADIELVHS